MLKVDASLEFTNELDIPAPDVYIDSSEVYNDKIIVYYYIQDSQDNWAVNPIVLDNISIFIYCNDVLFTESLISIKNRNKIIDGKVYSNVTFNIQSPDITLRAYCGNSKVKGKEVTEKVLSFNLLTQSSYDETTYTYYNKNKDLRILQVQNRFDYVNEDDINTSNISNHLYVSHTTNKNAALGFSFDLENFLIKKSKQYSTLKNNKKYREIILNNSYIVQDSVQFYKKNVTLLNSEYIKISSNVNIIKAQDGIDENIYIITSTDDGDHKNDTNKYSVKVSFSVNNYANEFLGDHIINKLSSVESFISTYKQIFEDISLDKKIVDKNTYIFENYYEMYFSEIKNAIQQLSEIFSFYTGNDISRYYSLFLSLFHPLTAKIYLFENLLNNIKLMNEYLIYLLDRTNDALQDNTNTKPFIGHEIEFKFKDLDGRIQYELIDYDYQYRNGYEVISMDESSIRFDEEIAGLKILSSAEKNVRLMYEANKYFGSTSSEIYSNIKHFSISYVDLPNKSYDILNSSIDEKITSYNEIFITLDQLKKFNFIFKTPESYYFQVLYENAYIKSISAKNNTSVNKLQKTIVFDPNLDSSQKSLQCIADTGVSKLYYILNKEYFMDVPSNIYQYKSSVQNDTTAVGVYPISADTKNNPEAKPSLIGHYNNFFEDRLVLAAQNYEVWSLEAVHLNDIYKNSLRLFNKYYILEKKKTLANNPEVIIEYPFESELTSNIPSKYLNRFVNSYELIASIEDL